jgi:hypothetical protein
MARARRLVLRRVLIAAGPVGGLAIRILRVSSIAVIRILLMAVLPTVTVLSRISALLAVLVCVGLYARMSLSHCGGTITSRRREVRIGASPLLWTRGAEEAWVIHPAPNARRIAPPATTKARYMLAM